MNAAPPLLLASTSRWRQELLAAAGIRCSLVAPPADEASVDDPDPRALAALRAHLKAASVHALRPDAWVVGADQVAHLDGVPFGKPTSPEDHRWRLRWLRGRTHTLTSAVAVLMGADVVVFQEDTLISFRSDLSDAELDAYVDCEEGSACAGGYRAEAWGAQLIERVDGDWNNVIGLPLYPLITTLRARGWRPDFPPPPPRTA